MNNSNHHNHNQQQQIISQYKIKEQKLNFIKDTIMHQQAMRLKPIEEREFPLLRKKQQLNNKTANSSDIEYLLEFVDSNVQQPQQLRLIQSNRQQQQSQKQKQGNILDTESITKYIVENSSKDGESIQERSKLISFIDLGLRIIAKVKKLMIRKKPQIKNNTKLPQDKQFSLIKDLFFPQNSSNSTQKIISNHSISNINTIKQQPKLIKTNSSSTSSQPQQMRQFRLQRQKDILLHKYSSHETLINKDIHRRYKYMLTTSLYQQLMQRKVSEKDMQCNIVKIIDGLEGKLEKLDVFHQRKQQRSSQQIMINQIWAIIDQVSTVFSISTNNSNNNINNLNNTNT